MAKLQNIAIIVMLGLVVSGMCITSPASAEEDGAQSSWYLRVTDDPESMGKIIGKYLKKKHNIKGNYQFDDDGDMYLIYEVYQGEPLQIKYVIDTPATAVSSDGGKKRVTERRVRVSAFYQIPEYAKNKEGRRAILELNNKWMNKTWVPHRINVQEKWIIAIQSSINVPGSEYPVHAESVRDILIRTSTFWKKYHKDLMGVLESIKK